MLIDAGGDSKGTTVQLYLQNQGVETLDYLILTHPDADHIGGADVITTKYDIENIFIGDYEKDNATYDDLLNVMEYKGYQYLTPGVGTQYQLGNATFTIIAPNDTYSDSNNSSIALILENGDTTFLFSGDAEQEAEADILNNGISIDCDVYHVGHHGSANSSSEAFVNAITPSYAVISCEEGNPYGYPHSETLDSLRAVGSQVFRTDEQGSLIAYSDGTEITWNCAPSETWQTGKVAENETTEERVLASISSSESSIGTYAVNSKNGKIHKVGACAATGTGKSAMKSPVYFDTYEEAEAYALPIVEDDSKVKCGNCW